MNKSFFYSIVAVLIIFFVACKKDEPETHECPPEIEDKNIAVINAQISTFKLASLKYENDSLEFDELKLSAIVPNEYLREYFWHNSSNLIPEGVTISDPHVKVGYISVIACNSAGSHIGYFDLNNGNWWYAEYIYADRDFTIKGNSKQGLVFDCYFEKGWNIRYYTPVEKDKYTTQKPLNEKFDWCYGEFGCM